MLPRYVPANRARHGSITKFELTESELELPVGSTVLVYRYNKSDNVEADLNFGFSPLDAVAAAAGLIYNFEWPTAQPH